jgi:hypothetical protein
MDGVRSVGIGREVVVPLVYAQRRPGERLGHSHTRPIAVPEDLDGLHGPARGVVELPLRVDWTPRRFYDLSRVSSVRSLYETVLRSAVHVDDVAAFVNRDRLVTVWSQLRIPARIRTIWEERFPELRT